MTPRIAMQNGSDKGYIQNTPHKLHNNNTNNNTKFAVTKIYSNDGWTTYYRTV